MDTLERLKESVKRIHHNVDVAGLRQREGISPLAVFKREMVEFENIAADVARRGRALEPLKAISKIFWELPWGLRSEMEHIGETEPKGPARRRKELEHLHKGIEATIFSVAQPIAYFASGFYPAETALFVGRMLDRVAENDVYGLRRGGAELLNGQIVPRCGWFPLDQPWLYKMLRTYRESLVSMAKRFEAGEDDMRLDKHLGCLYHHSDGYPDPTELPRLAVVPNVALAHGGLAGGYERLEDFCMTKGQEEAVRRLIEAPTEAQKKFRKVSLAPSPLFNGA